MTGPISPTTISAGIVLGEQLDEQVDITAVGVHHGEVLDAAVVAL